MDNLSTQLRSVTYFIFRPLCDDLWFMCVSESKMSLCFLLADGADKAGRVVGLAQGGDHFPLHKVPTAIAAGAMHALVVQRAQILSILHKEAPLG